VECDAFQLLRINNLDDGHWIEVAKAGRAPTQRRTTQSEEAFNGVLQCSHREGARWRVVTRFGGAGWGMKTGRTSWPNDSYTRRTCSLWAGNCENSSMMRWYRRRLPASHRAATVRATDEALRFLIARAEVEDHADTAVHRRPPGSRGGTIARWPKEVRRVGEKVREGTPATGVLSIIEGGFGPSDRSDRGKKLGRSHR